MKKINVDKLIEKFEENPVAFMAAGGAALMGIGRIITAIGNYRGSNAYARQVNYRIKKNK
jgi:hypothetical protein